MLARLEHEIEVAPIDRLLRPPAVDDAPLLAQARDADAIHAPRDAHGARLDEGGTRRVQASRSSPGYSSRGTNSARASGIRDHGATSTTAQTDPEPVLART